MTEIRRATARSVSTECWHRSSTTTSSHSHCQAVCRDTPTTRRRDGKGLVDPLRYGPNVHGPRSCQHHVIISRPSVYAFRSRTMYDHVIQQNPSFTSLGNETLIEIICIDVEIDLHLLHGVSSLSYRFS